MVECRSKEATEEACYTHSTLDDQTANTGKEEVVALIKSILIKFP